MHGKFLLYFFYGHTIFTSITILSDSYNRFFLQMSFSNISISITKFLFSLSIITISILLARLLVTNKLKLWTRLSVIHFTELLFYTLFHVFFNRHSLEPTTEPKLTFSFDPDQCDRLFDTRYLSAAEIIFSSILQLTAYFCFFQVYNSKRSDYTITNTGYEIADG